MENSSKSLRNCFSKVNKTNKKNNVIKGNVGNEFQVMEQNITG